MVVQITMRIMIDTVGGPGAEVMRGGGQEVARLSKTTEDLTVLNTVLKDHQGVAEHVQTMADSTVETDLFPGLIQGLSPDPHQKRQ